MSVFLIFLVFLASVALPQGSKNSGMSRQFCFWTKSISFHPKPSECFSTQNQSGWFSSYYAFHAFQLSSSLDAIYLRQRTSTIHSKISPLGFHPHKKTAHCSPFYIKACPNATHLNSIEKAIRRIDGISSHETKTKKKIEIISIRAIKFTHKYEDCIEAWKCNSKTVQMKYSLFVVTIHLLIVVSWKWKAFDSALLSEQKKSWNCRETASSMIKIKWIRKTKRRHREHY